MTEQVEQQICIKFALSLNYSFTEIIWMIQKPAAMGNLWLTASSQPHTRSCIMPRGKTFGKTSNHPGDSVPLQPRFGALWLLAFPKTKITFEKEEISDCWWDWGKYDGAADGNGKKCVRFQGAYFDGDWGVIILCTMFLVSCIFFSKCLYFSYYLAGYSLDRPSIITIYSEVWNKRVIAPSKGKMSMTEVLGCTTQWAPEILSLPPPFSPREQLPIVAGPFVLQHSSVLPLTLLTTQ